MRLIRSIEIIIILLSLSACITVKTPPSQPEPNVPLSTKLDSLPRDALRFKSVEDIQMVMANRGIYLTDNGQVKYLGKPNCGGLNLQSHRGLPSYPENSISSIVFANLNGFDTVEIDAIPLADGEWVVHHDSFSGRATSTIDGKNIEIERVRLEKWRHLLLRNPQTGELLNILPPTLLEAILAFKKSAALRQTLNVEIKGNPSKKELSTLDYLLHRHLGAGSYYYSAMDLDVLTHMRSINDNVYLGFIQKPHPASVKQLTRMIKKGVSNDPVFIKYQEDINTIDRLGFHFYRPKRYDHQRGLKKLKMGLGPNYGLHLDIRHYQERSGLTELARKMGAKLIATYTINGQKYHQQQLKKAQRSKRLPDSVIIDDDVFGFCSKMEPLKSQRRFEIKSENGKLLEKLPMDADFSRFNEQIDLIKQSMYIAITGNIKPLDLTEQMSLSSKQKRTKLTVGARQPKEDFSLESGTPILIILDIDKAE